MLHLLEVRHPALLDVADGAVREALPLIACKWFLNLFVDTLPLASLLAAWNLIFDAPDGADPGPADEHCAAVSATATDRPTQPTPPPSGAPSGGRTPR